MIIQHKYRYRIIKYTTGFICTLVRIIGKYKKKKKKKIFLSRILGKMWKHILVILYNPMVLAWELKDNFT